MPYKRKSYKPRYRRRRYASRKSAPSWLQYIRNSSAVSNTASLAWSAWKGMNRIRRLVNVEKKKLDTAISNSPDNSTFTNTFVTHLSAVPLGDSDAQRDGNSIRPQYLLIRGHLVMNGSATNTCVRYIVFQDTQQQSDTIPAVSDVLETSFGFVVNNPLNSETVGRFRIISDWNCVVDTDNPLYTFKKNIRLSGHIRYNGTTGTDIQKDGLYILAVSDQVTNTPTSTLTCRLSFTDN